MVLDSNVVDIKNKFSYNLIGNLNNSLNFVLVGEADVILFFRIIFFRFVFFIKKSKKLRRGLRSKIRGRKKVMEDFGINDVEV